MARCCRTNDFGASCDSENLICSRKRKRKRERWGASRRESSERRETPMLIQEFDRRPSRLPEISFDSFFLDALSSISYRNDFPKQHRDYVDLTKLLKAQYIAKFRKSLLIKCLQAGLWRWHNAEFVYKMIIMRTHWHIYRAMEGCPSIGPRH